MLVALIHFAANLLIVGYLIRVVQAKWPDSTVGKALLFIY